MEEHQKALNFLVGCLRQFSWRACVLYIKGGLKGKWVLTREQLKLISDPWLRGCRAFWRRGGVNLCPVVASGGVCKIVCLSKAIKLLMCLILKKNSISVLPA